MLDNVYDADSGIVDDTTRIARKLRKIKSRRKRKFNNLRNEGLYKRRRCVYVLGNGQRCKAWTMRGAGCTHCHAHSTDDEKEIHHQAMAAVDAGQSITQNKVPCDCLTTEGQPCKRNAVPGYNSCVMHLSLTEKRQYKRNYNLRREREAAKDYYKAIKTSRKKTMKDGIIVPGKQYTGYLHNEDTEKQIKKNNELFGFYGGAFLDKYQRQLFKSVPVGDLDDDIKVIRYLVRDALENQMLFLAAHAAGKVDKKGFVTFSKEVAKTLDEGGNTIISTSRTIKRRQDYLADIERLTKLVTIMERGRIDVKAASDEFDKEIVPFHFNILPPSKDHPLHGDKEEEEISEKEDDERIDSE